MEHLCPALLQEQVSPSRYAGWIRTCLRRIVNDGWDFEITHNGRGSNNIGDSHFNLQVEDLPRIQQGTYPYFQDISVYIGFSHYESLTKKTLVYM